VKYGNVRLFSPAALFTALTLSLSNPAIGHAQSFAMEAKVPFEFYVGKVCLPAGSYTVERAGVSGEVIRVADNQGLSVMILTNASSNAGSGVTSELVFNRYADSFFLSEVRWSDFRIARSVRTSSPERELARTAKSHRVIVAAAHSQPY